jgi:hypothetical protein
MEIPPPSFSRILRCPVTGLALEWITPDALPSLGIRPEQSESWSGALLRSDLRALFPVRSGIPVLLSEELHSVGEGPALDKVPA